MTDLDFHHRYLQTMQKTDWELSMVTSEVLRQKRIHAQNVIQEQQRLARSWDSQGEVLQLYAKLRRQRRLYSENNSGQSFTS